MGKTLIDLEASIDRVETIKAMKAELEQLYYFKEHSEGVEDSALGYMSYTSSIVYAGKKSRHTQGDELLLAAIAKKDQMHALQQRYEEQRKQITAEILEGIAQLPEKERILMEDLYVKKRDKLLIAYTLGISQSTMRRKVNEAVYHLAIMLHKTIPTKGKTLQTC